MKWIKTLIPLIHKCVKHDSPLRSLIVVISASFHNIELNCYDNRLLLCCYCYYSSKEGLKIRHSTWCAGIKGAFMIFFSLCLKEEEEGAHLVQVGGAHSSASSGSRNEAMKSVVVQES